MGASDYDALLYNLRESTSEPDKSEFTRPNLIALLDVLTTHLGEALALKLGELEDGTHVEAEHAVADLLSGLSSALQDLDKGLTDPVFKPIKGKKNSARRWRLRQEDDVLFEALEIFQRLKRLPDRKAAARRLGVTLKSSEYMRRGKELNGSSLYALYHKYR